MAISPSTVSFTYKKTTAIPPGQLLSHTTSFYSTPTLVTTGLPDYLDFYDITTTSLKVKVNAAASDLLSPGLHSEVVSIELLDVDFEIPKQKHIGDFTINLTIQDTIVLTLAPVSASFEFQISGSTPANKSVSITSEVKTPRPLPFDSAM